LGITKTKTVLSLMLVVVITILTTLTLTTTIAAYAGGGDDHDNGNKQKAEDDSSAAIADCDDNEVERAGFDCIAIAANDVEIEPPKATLSVCKETFNEPDFSPEDFVFTVTGNNPSPAQFEGDASCVDVTIGPGEYAVSETPVPEAEATEMLGDCVQDPPITRSHRATGEIQSGETQECTFINYSPN
jgi:hypothetical protein